MLLEYAHFELGVAKENSRVVVCNGDWLGVVPWWAVWPYEVLLLPYRRHVTSLADLTQEEVTSFALALSEVTTKYDNLFATSFAYSMGIHQRPVPLDPRGGDDMYADAHLHLHFNPPLLRSASVRKFLVGYEMMGEPQRDLTPEQAAKRLRDQSTQHYLDRMHVQQTKGPA